MLRLPADLRRAVLPHEPEPGASAPRAVYLTIVYVLRRAFAEDRLPAMAAVLTLQTALAVAPAVGVALAGIGALEPADAERLLGRIFATWMPGGARAAETARGVLDLAAGVSLRELGIAGFLGALAVAYLAFASLEATLSRVFRADRRHGFVVKFTLFYTLATLGPLIALYSLRAGLGGEAGVLPRLAVVCALAVLYVLVPRAKVTATGALSGALLAAGLIEVARRIFGLYLDRASGLYESIYGPLALLPVFLVWSYISWLAVLLGAEVAYVVQHRNTLRLSGWMPQSGGADVTPRCAGPVSARLLLAVADNFDRHGSSFDAHDLAERFDLPVDDVVAILRRLDACGFVARTQSKAGSAIVPAMPLDRIRLVDVLAAFDMRPPAKVRLDRLGELLEELAASRARVAGDVTYADLLADARSRRTADAAEPEP